MLICWVKVTHSRNARRRIVASCFQQQRPAIMVSVIQGKMLGGRNHFPRQTSMAQGQKTHPTFFVSQPFFMTGVLGFGIEEDEAPIWPKKHLKPRTKSNAAKRVDDVFGSMEGTIIVLREATRGMGAVCILELRSTTRNPFQSPGDQILASSAARRRISCCSLSLIAPRCREREREFTSDLTKHTM